MTGNNNNNNYSLFNYEIAQIFANPFDSVLFVGVYGFKND